MSTTDAAYEAALEAEAEDSREAWGLTPHADLCDDVHAIRARLASLESEFARIRPVYEAACAARDKAAALESAIKAGARASQFGHARLRAERAIEVARDASLEADEAMFAAVDAARSATATFRVAARSILDGATSVTTKETP